ncbi:hypothetical protein ACPEIC_27705 [Stenotrophomonas sp. NPDC087984]
MTDRRSGALVACPTGSCFTGVPAGNRDGMGRIQSIRDLDGTRLRKLSTGGGSAPSMQLPRRAAVLGDHGRLAGVRGRERGSHLRGAAGHAVPVARDVNAPTSTPSAADPVFMVDGVIAELP